MNLVIACDSFKGTLTSRAANGAISRAAAQVMPGTSAQCVPLADGGEGTVEVFRAHAGGVLRPVIVTGPLGERVQSSFLMLPDGETAVMEMAAASGLSLVASERRDPTRTTSYGTGELITAALQAGARQILIGVGDSATVDGGCGAAQALGVRFVRDDGSTWERPITGGDLGAIASVDLAGRDPRLSATDLTVLCDVANPLCGPNGAARVYGPQKGATGEMVDVLERGLQRLAGIVERDLGIDVTDMPRCGAAGGLPAGLLAFAGACLTSGANTILDLIRFDRILAGADLVITGEGCIDEQTIMGKVVAGVAGAARRSAKPVIAFVGQIGAGAEQALAMLDGCYETQHDVAGRGDPAAALERTTAVVLDHFSRHGALPDPSAL